MTSLANVSGNCLVLASGATSRACRKRVAALILNLALTDLFALVGLLSLAVDATNYVSTVEYFNEDFLTVICHGKLYCAVAYYYAQILTMAAIALDRCMRIVYADIYTRYMRFGGHYLTIALIWIVSCAWFSASVIGFGLESKYVSFTTRKSLNSTYGGFCGPVLRSGVNKTVAQFSFWFLPGIIVVIVCAICYVKIFKYFYASRKELQTIASESNNRSPTVSNNFKNLYLHIATVCILLVTQILGLILGVVTSFLHEYKQWAMFATYFVYPLNSSINPWLSIVFIDDFACAVQALSECKSFRSYKRKLWVSGLG